MGKNDKGKNPTAKIQPGESFADAVREGTPADPHGNQNAALKPGESYADAVQEGLNDSETPPPYSAGSSKPAGDSKSASHTAAQSGGQGSGQGKGKALHLPNSHHVASPTPSPGGGGRGQSHPHSHHLSTQGQQGQTGWPFGGTRARDAEEGRIVMVPEREYVYALMRARRRFWATLFWALLIYLVAGAIVGGGVADANSHRDKHRGKDGRWRDNAVTPVVPFERAGVAAVDQEVETPWDFAMEAVTE